MRLIVVTFKIERDTLDILDAVAGSLRMNRSEFIRKAIENELRKYTDTQVPKARVERMSL